MAKRLRNKPAAPRQRSMLADVLPTDIGVKAAQGYIFAQGLSLAALHAAIAFLWYGFAVLAMDQVGAFLRRPAIARSIKAMTGVLLIAFGARLATIRSPAP